MIQLYRVRTVEVNKGSCRFPPDWAFRDITLSLSALFISCSGSDWTAARWSCRAGGVAGQVELQGRCF